MRVANYIGIPFERWGRNANGLDCWGLVRWVIKQEINIQLPSYVDEYATTEAVDVAPVIATHADDYEDVKIGNEQTYDIIVLRNGRLPNHVALVVTPGMMLHVLRGAKTCVQSYHSYEWRSRIVGFHRIKR